MLQKLTERYKNIIIEKVDGNKIHLHNLWGDDSFFLRFSKDEDLHFLDDLYFPPELVAFYSLTENFLEVIAFPLPPDDELLKRKFNFNYQGETFECAFRKPSEHFKKIATGFREDKEESKTAYRNLRQFRDYYRRDELPDFLSKYFSNKEPYNFVIQGNLNRVHNQLLDFCKTLNFYMLFFDRESPTLQIFSKPYNIETLTKPCYSLFDKFPSDINATEIDDVLLDIITVANNSNDVRLKFIFYYQILEYASYYYLKSDVKTRLNALLRKPDISYKAEEYSKVIIEEFKDNFKNNDDKQKLDMLVSESITLSDIKLELENNMDYFSKTIEFDGGFSIDPIMKNEIEGIEQLPENIIKVLKDNILNIRNCLVHLREFRENKVILPTEKNDNLLLPYLYLIRRISEQIMMR